MAVMRPTSRLTVPGLASLVLLALLAALVGGCSDGAGSEDARPKVTATGPHDPTTGSAASSSPTEGETDEPTGTTEPTSSPSDLPDAVSAVCTPYAVMVSAIQDAASSSSDPDQVAAAIGPVMKEFAAQVPDLERPPGMSATTWHAVEVLAERILALPDPPTNAEIEGVEQQLTPAERDAVEQAAAWFKANCGL